MSMLIIGNRKTGRTARAIAKYLKCSYHGSNQPVEGNFDVVFRYGNSTTPLHIGGTRVIINSAGNIRRVARKPFFRAELLRAGLSAPMLYNTWDLGDVKFPIICRPTYHQCGYNFKVAPTKEVAKKYSEKGYYLQEMIKKEVEYRVFICYGKVMEVNQKIPLSDDHNPLVWNHRGGWGFKYIPYNTSPINVREAAKNACSISGLRFCAVDVCVDKDGREYIFELNSGPGLIDRKIKKLVEYITSEIKIHQDTEPPPIDMEIAPQDEEHPRIVQWTRIRREIFGE